MVALDLGSGGQSALIKGDIENAIGGTVPLFGAPEVLTQQGMYHTKIRGEKTQKCVCTVEEGGITEEKMRPANGKDAFNTGRSVLGRNSHGS